MDNEPKEADLSHLYHQQEMAEILDGGKQTEMPNLIPIRNSNVSSKHRGREPVSKIHQL